MIKVLEDAIEKVKTLPVEQQELAAELLAQLSEADATPALTDAERRAVREGLAELDRGERASDADVRAVFNKYRA